MSALSDILLASDVRPFAISAAIMVALGGIELMSMLVGLSIGEFVGHDLGIDADSHNALGGLFLWINAGRLPLLILIVLVLGAFSIEGFLLQAIAHAVGAVVPVPVAALAAAAGSIPVIRIASRGIARIIPRDESYAVSESDFVGKVATVTIGPLDQGDYPAGFVSRMSSATGIRCRPAPVLTRTRCRSAPASCWSTATPGALSPSPPPPTSLHTNNHLTGLNMWEFAVPVAIGVIAVFVIGLMFAILYKRSTRDEAYVRTGLGGQKVVLDGGSIVLRFFIPRPRST